MEVVGPFPKSTVITENKSLLTVVYGDLRELNKALIKMVDNSSKWTVIYKSGRWFKQVGGHWWKFSVIYESGRLRKHRKFRFWWKSSFVVKMTISKPIDVNTLVMIHSKCPSTQSSNSILWREIKFYSSSATICRYRENGSLKWQWFCFDLYMGQNNHLFTTWHNRTFIGFIVFNSMYECDRK